jgi:hypothetical protein
LATTTGSTGKVTVIIESASFTMFELSDSADCVKLKSYLVRKGFKDITPVQPGKTSTTSFKGSNAKGGKDIISKLQATPADWLILSGHHGILYASDYELFGDINVSANLENCLNNNKYAGFFNDDYHHGRWENATQLDPALNSTSQGLSQYYSREIFCSTTDPASPSIAPFDQQNPYLPGTALNTKCKGIILSACNTFSYRSVRKKWGDSFPDAVIFGTFARIPEGLRVANALASAPSTTKSFWIDPQAYLNSAPDKPEKFALEISKYGARQGVSLGMIYQKKAYFPSSSSGNISIQVLPYDFSY